MTMEFRFCRKEDFGSANDDAMNSKVRTSGCCSWCLGGRRQVDLQPKWIAKMRVSMVRTRRIAEQHQRRKASQQLVTRT